MLNWLKKQKPKSLGQLGEEYAQREYKKRGYKIVAANFFNRKGKRLGEIDIVAADKKKIIFVEVKTRHINDKKFGTGAEAVNIFKQLKILKAVKIFLLKNRKYADLQPQIDVCVVDYNELDINPFCAKIISNAVEDWS